MGKIRRAIISVSDKAGVANFAKGLVGIGIEILSTGGTAKTLREEGVFVKDISEYTGFPEMLDGRVKTLHPKVHGGLLGMRSNPAHVKKMEEHGILPIDMIVVNLYPFEATVAEEGCVLEDAIENIDIGGPTMLRAAAKNYPDVTVLVDPADYEGVLFELKEKGEISVDTNFRLAKKVFQHTARYDGTISNYLGCIDEKGKKSLVFPETFTIQVKKAQDLRYGENPHQSGAFYKEYDLSEPSIATAFQIQGKELSFNNILDADSALETVKEFDEPACVIIKHNNPCGAGISSLGLVDAYRKARDCDPVSAFGGVVGFNWIVNEETARELVNIFLEVVIANGFDPAALEILKNKKDVRLLQVPLAMHYKIKPFNLRKVVGGLLLQDRDLGKVPMDKWKVVTRRQPTDEERKAMAFGWKVAKHVKSNAIVLVREDRTIGIGAGQMSRVDSTRLAVMKARQSNFDPIGTVLASDAMFPFRDGLDAAAESGATAVIQPGGSIRDDEVIAAADEHNIAMVFTGMRHFRH